MKIAIFSEDNLDVARGVDQLITKYSEQSPEIIFPVKARQDDFSQSVIRNCIENKVKVTAYTKDISHMSFIGYQATKVVIADDPIQEVLHQLSPGDAVGIVWLDTMGDHLVLHTLEDLALDVWDITDGLDPIEIDDDPFTNMDPDDLHDTIHKTVDVLVDMLAAYVATTVMESLGEAVMEHILNQQKKNISPFDDLDD
jgi:hypothetical protein